MEERTISPHPAAAWRESIRDGAREGLTRGWAAINALGARRRLERRLLGYDDAGSGATPLSRATIERPAADLSPLHPDDPAARAVARFYHAAYPRAVAHPVGVWELEDARVHPELGLHVGRAGIFAPSHCGAEVFDNPKYAAAQHALPLLRAKPIRGEAVLLAPSWHHNFYHWMIDILPRLDLLDAAGVTSPLILPANARGFARATLELMGLGDRMLPLGRGAYRIDRLILPGSLSPALDFSTEKARFLRDRFLPRARATGAGGAGARLYISRADAAIRRVTNEADLLPGLLARGFAPLLPTTRTVAEQAVAFASADFIVAPHGAALANLAFCRPGTRIIEVFCDGHFSPSYYRIAQELGLVYGFVVAPRRGAHLHVPAAALHELIDRMA